MYQLVIDPWSGSESVFVRRTSDSALIPFDEKNADFRQYQAWLADGNTPLPAQ